MHDHLQTKINYPPPSVEVNGHQIEEVVILKYLGVWISSDLSWTI